MTLKKLFFAASLLCATWLVPGGLFAQVTPADNEIWWGHYLDTDELLGLGSGEVERYDCAIHTGRSNALLSGHRIRAVRFTVQGVSSLQDVKVWLSLGLPDNTDEADIVVDVPKEALKEATPTEILLPEPFTVGTTGVYVGYSMTQTYIGTTPQAFPVLTTTHEDDLEGAIYMKSSRNFPNWTSFQGLGYGRMAIQVLIDGDFQTDAVSAVNFGDAITLANDSVSVPFTLTNYGTHGIRDFEYTISTDGATEFTRHVTLSEPFMGYGCSTTTPVQLIADPNYGRQPKTITVTKVNGQPNAIGGSAAVANGTLITLESSAPHRTVYEEFTATWSGGCPRGITGRKLLQEKHPDDAIWISVHSGTEVMAIQEYQKVFNRIGLTPSGLVNRSLRADPYYGSQMPRGGFALDKDIAADQKAVAEASVELSEPQMDKSGHIRFATEVKFNYDRDDAPYALGYVLLCDGLKGSTSEWYQANSYPSWKGTTFFDQNDQNLLYWTTQPASITDMVYDNVAVAAVGVDKGIAGSITAPIRMGEAQNHPYDMELGFNTLAQNLYQLSVVALLFNTETGEIVNAARRPVNVSDEFVGTSATVADFGKILGVAGQKAEIPVVVENYGKQDITRLSFRLQLDGADYATPAISVSPALPFGSKRTFNIPVQLPSVVNDFAAALTLTQVNGSDNEVLAHHTASGSLRTLSEAPFHKVYVEEYTGTWCGFCPRGTLGLRLAEERHPGKFVCAAVHRNDPMEIQAFSPYLSANVSGYPSSTINRSFMIDPYMGNRSSGFGLGEVIEEEHAKLTEARVRLEVPTYDKSSLSVAVTAYADFCFNAEEAPYALGFLLRADGLKGTSSDWFQHNYYAGYQGTTAYQNDADLQTIIQQGEYLRDPFNHVPIAGAGVERGLSQSITAPIRYDQPQEYVHVFDLSDNTLLQDWDQLSVVVLLFNTETGEVINCEEAHVKDIVGISSPLVTPHSSTIYDLQGRRLQRIPRGVSIVNGRKVLR
ncbi:MAG: hypothetical protein IJ692_00170 [Alloprevotella sp.]|nr:hypothetical protein [Alloprevotella sp.]